MNSLNNLDIIILQIMGIRVGVGLWKRLVRQLFYLSGIILGCIVSVKLYVQVASLFSQSDSSISKAIIFIGIFFCCIILTSIAGYFLERILNLGGLSWLDRLGGGFLWFMKGMFVVVTITTVLITFLPSDSPVLIKSSMLHMSFLLPSVSIGLSLMRSRGNSLIESKRLTALDREAD